MGKKLSIVVTHYKEPLEVCKPLFDSIALQQGVNLDDVEVIIVNDGLDDESLKTLYAIGLGYKLDISHTAIEHSGVSAARNKGLELANGEYVMFADADDMFVSLYGLHLIFSAIQEQPDAIVSSFVEEQKDKDGNYKLFRHDNDTTFIHGKVWRKQFLVEKELKFDETLTIHEDGYFNTVALVCADTKKPITTPFYMWKWNESSTVRKDSELYVLKTYEHLMKSRAAIARELFKRGYINEYFDCVIKTFLDSYYDFNKPEALVKQNAKLIKSAEKAFKGFCIEFKKDFDEAATDRKAELAYVARSQAYTKGLVMENITFKDWLIHILKEVK